MTSSSNTGAAGFPMPFTTTCDSLVKLLLTTGTPQVRDELQSSFFLRKLLLQTKLRNKGAASSLEFNDARAALEEMDGNNNIFVMIKCSQPSNQIA